MRVPRYGMHNGVKYTPRRTLIRICEHCGQVFINNGHGQKFCSEECQLEVRQKNIRENHNPINNPINNPDNNFKNNPKYPSIYHPPRNEEERIQRNIAWKTWYNNLTLEQKIKYNNKKRRGATKKEDTYEDIRAEMEALGLR